MEEGWTDSDEGMQPGKEYVNPDGDDVFNDTDMYGIRKQLDELKIPYSAHLLSFHRNTPTITTTFSNEMFIYVGTWPPNGTIQAPPVYEGDLSTITDKLNEGLLTKEAQESIRKLIS